jgi:DNA polymerase
VKHFKFVPRGKRRIHQKPEVREVNACRFWLDIELAEVQPDLVVMLGATAGRAVLGRPVTIARDRGMLRMNSGQPAFLTVHPSYLLRLPDEESKKREWELFLGDLRQAAQIAARIERGSNDPGAVGIED